MLKKIFIISAVLLLVSTVFFGIYIIAFKPESGVSIKKVTEEEKKSDIEKFMSKKLVNITSEPVISATIGPDNETIRYYNGIDGRAWTMTLRGTNQEVLLNETDGVPNSVKWSKNGNSAILTYDNGNIFVTDYATGKKNKLRDGMDNVEWANSNNRILYKYYDEKKGERSLNVADSDGSNWKKIAELPFRHTSFTQIPASIMAAFWPSGDVDIDTKLFKINTVNESTPKEIFADKKGAEYKFSPDGKKVLISFSYDEGKKTMLAVMDSDGSNYNEFMIPTVVKKTTWAPNSNTVYYAQPTNVPENAIWPNDYNEEKFNTSDTFYKIDVESGKKDRIIELKELDEELDAVDLFVTHSEDKLFFINRSNKLLYKLNL